MAYCSLVVVKVKVKMVYAGNKVIFIMIILAHRINYNASYDNNDDDYSLRMIMKGIIVLAMFIIIFRIDIS